MKAISNLIYTGIGSRQTPRDIMQIMYNLAVTAGNKGWTLRSGKAYGADTAFQLGAQDVKKNRKVRAEIYVPWYGFSNDINRNPLTHKLNHNLDIMIKYNSEIARKATEIARELHPAWGRCSTGAQKLHTRNVYQVLGADLNTPTRFVICWAPEDEHGIIQGGTYMATRLAQLRDIPVINMFNKDWNSKLIEVVQSITGKEVTCNEIKKN